MNRDPLISREIDARLDQLCDAFEHAWGHGEQPRIEDYLAQAEPSLRPQLLPELLLSEVECRRRRGESLTAREYRARFPEQAVLIDQLFKPATTPPGRPAPPAGAIALTVSELVEQVRRLQLLRGRQLAELSALAAQHPEAKDLARAALQRGLFTAYQINRLLQGRFQELSLGSYVVLDRVGEGGMGAVYKARHKAMGRAVALKVIRKEHLTNPGVTRRFEREMQAVAQLNHPNVVRAFDADLLDGTYVLVMEFIEGAVDLGKLVKQRGPLPVAEACDYIRQAALGLQHAHECGLVHRDIKPHNLLVSRSREPSGTLSGGGPQRESASQGPARLAGPTVKILDMGLARIRRPGTDAGESSSALTREGMVMGTLDYIAPEQATDSHTVDIRADLYSLGCTFYHLLTGRPPFPGGEALVKLMKHKTEAARPVEQLRPEVSPPVADILRRLMAKNPDDRFQTPAELVEALDQALGLVTDEFSAGGGDSATEHATPPEATPEEATPPEVSPPDGGTDEDIAAAPAPAAATPALARPVAASTAPANPAPAATAWSEIVQSPSATELLVKPPSPTAPARRWPWPWIGGIAVVAALLLIVLVWQPGRGPATKKEDADSFVLPPRPRPRPVVDKSELQAREALAPLAARTNDPKADLPTLRDELRAFLRKHSGTESATKACGVLGSVLARMPSPLDNLSHKNIPAECIEHWKTWQRACGDKYAAGPPPELVAVIGEHRQRHWDAAVSLALSPDAKLLASIGMRDNAVCLWDAEKMELLQYIHFGWNGGNVAFAPDGKSLAASHNDAICVFDVVNRRLIEAARVECPYSYHLAWSPDGTRLATVSGDHFIRLWDYRDKKLKPAWKSNRQDGIPEAVVFAREGTRLVTGSSAGKSADGKDVEPSLRLWDLSSDPPTLLQSLNVKRGLSRGLALSADSQYLAWAGEHLQVWRLTDKELQTVLGGDVDQLKSNHGICWLGTEPVLLVRYSRTLAVLDLADGKARLRRPELDVPPLYTPCLTTSVDGKVLAGAPTEDGGVRVWDVVKKQVEVPDPDDAKPLRTVRRPSGLKERRPPDARFTGVAALCFLPEGDLAVGGPDGAVHLWDLSGQTKETWFPTGEAARAAPRYLGTGGVPAIPNRVFGIAFLPGGNRFAVAVGHHVEIWDRGAEKARIFGDPPKMGQSLAVSPDGATLVSAFGEGPLRFYDVAEPGREHRVHEEVLGKRTPTWAAFSPDGARLAVACQNENAVQLWRMPAQDAQVICDLTTHSPVWTAFTPDGRTLLAAGQDNRLTFWDATRTPPTEIDKLLLFNQAQFFKSLDISPDGRWLAAMRCDGGVPFSYHVVVWDLVEQRVEREWPWPGNIVHLRFAPDGRHLAVGNSNGTVYVLRFTPDKLRPWRDKVAELPVKDQVAAVLRKLKEHNPDFDDEADQRKHYDDEGKLLHFNLYSDHITDLTPVRAFPHLVAVECIGRGFEKGKRGTGKLKDLSAFRGLRLTGFNCSTNPHVSDLAPLAKMPLSTLALPYTAVSDLSPLGGMSLATLNCKGCPVSDLAPLREMPLLWLDLGETNVKDLSALKDMPLKTLYLEDTQVTDLGPLATLGKLEILWVQKTKVVDLSPLEKTALVEIHLDDPVRHRAALRKIKTLKTINGVPADKALK
ncbi:MAG: protein kinase [Gemmataceae bacterium]|nr:protein kinase [Gemmataceae bacterium]